MKSKLFAFIALPTINPTADTDMLLNDLNQKFSSFLRFDRNDHLLLTRAEDVSFYVTILNSEDELDNWITMGKDFELTIDMTPLTKETLEYRYQKIKAESPTLYSETDFAIARGIFEEMDKMPGREILSFQ